jgi:hypothetical protein
MPSILSSAGHDTRKTDWEYEKGMPINKNKRDVNVLYIP